MAEHIHTFVFWIGDRVRIRAIDQPAIIVGAMHAIRGDSYQVVFWQGGSRQELWVFQHEIELAGNMGPVGFSACESKGE